MTGSATTTGIGIIGLGLADLIVVDGDPIEDIAVLQDRQRINLVMKDGHVYHDELSPGGTATS